MKRNYLILLVILLAFALRLVNLNGRPLWYDEAFSVLYAEKSLSTILAGTVTQVGGVAADVHPIFYYSLLHGWMELVGQTPVAVRLFSAVLGAVTVGIGALLGRRLFGARAGSVTAVFIAIAPFHVYYSQEARMYALLGLAALSGVYAFVRGWQDGHWRWWLAFGGLGAVTLYAHNLGAMVLLALDLWVLWRWWRHRWGWRWRQLVVAHALMLLLFAPWLLVLPAQLGNVQQGYWITRPGFLEAMQTLLVFHFTADNQAFPGWLTAAALFFSLLIPLALLLELNRRRAMTEPETPAFPAVSLLLFLVIVPVAATFAVSQIRPIYIIRAMLPSALAYYVLLAGGFSAEIVPRPVRWGIGLPALVIVALALANHYSYEQFPRPPFADAAAYLAQRADPANDVIVHSNKITFLPTRYYNRSLPQQFIADAPGSPGDTLAPATQRALEVTETPDLETAVIGHERIWFLIFARGIAEHEEATASHPHLDWLRRHYRRTALVTFNDLLVYRFER